MKIIRWTSKKKKTACVGAQNGRVKKGVVCFDTPIIAQFNKKIKIGEKKWQEKLKDIERRWQSLI